MSTAVIRQIEQERLSAIDEVIVTVNHKINNPLTTILNYAELLKMNPSENNQQISKGLEKIINAAKEIKNVTHQLATLKNPERIPYMNDITMIALPSDHS